jgi:hypothetical protein
MKRRCPRSSGELLNKIRHVDEILLWAFLTRRDSFTVLLISGFGTDSPFSAGIGSGPPACPWHNIELEPIRNCGFHSAGSGTSDELSSKPQHSDVQIRVVTSHTSRRLGIH